MKDYTGVIMPLENKVDLLKILKYSSVGTWCFKRYVENLEVSDIKNILQKFEGNFSFFEYNRIAIGASEDELHN